MIRLQLTFSPSLCSGREPCSHDGLSLSGGRLPPHQSTILKGTQMTRIKLSDYGNSPFEKLIGNNKAILDKWIELENVLFSGSYLAPELLEQVRRTLAFGNECEY